MSPHGDAWNRVAYTATRVTRDSTRSFEQTRARFDELVPLLEPSLSQELVLGGATWAEVESVVRGTAGPTGLVALARLDQGALLSLSGEPLQATLYLVGNPVIARTVIAREPAAALYAPFRAAIYRNATGVHVSYDQPSSVFASLDAPAIDAITTDLDEKIRTVVDDSCR